MLPNNILSSRVISASFLAPRENTRLSEIDGRNDVHYGGIALNDPSYGIIYQLWTATLSITGDVLLEATNTPRYTLLAGVNAVWVALAFDQNARVFVAYATAEGVASYYWYDTTIPGYTTSILPGSVPRVFASLDDSRIAESASADIILAYIRAGELYFRQQRDRFGVEYALTPVSNLLVQIGMNRVNRFQFAVQNETGGAALPPLEFNPGASR